MRCSCCYSFDFQLSAFRRWESLLLLILIRPFRCQVCEERAFRFVGTPALVSFIRRLDLGRRFSGAVAAVGNRAARLRSVCSSALPSGKVVDEPGEDDVFRLDEPQVQ